MYPYIIKYLNFSSQRMSGTVFNQHRFLPPFHVLLLVGLQHLKQLSMNSCRYVTDMKKLLPVKETLEQLDIGNCGGISDLTPLHELTLVSIILKLTDPVYFWANSFTDHKKSYMLHYP